MKFYRRLYVGPSIRNVNKIKWKLLTGRGQLGIYLISLSRTSDQLDIFHCALLKSLFGEFLRTPVSEGGVEPLVVEPPHVVVEVGA